MSLRRSIVTLLALLPFISRNATPPAAALPVDATSDAVFVVSERVGPGTHKLVLRCEPPETTGVYEVLLAHARFPVKGDPLAQRPFSFIESHPNLHRVGPDGGGLRAGDLVVTGDPDARSFERGEHEEHGSYWFKALTYSIDIDESTDFVFAVASFGGALGPCVGELNGQPVEIEQLDGDIAGWRDLGGSENLAWYQDGGHQIGAHQLFEHQLSGGIYIGEVYLGTDGAGVAALQGDDGAGAAGSSVRWQDMSPGHRSYLSMVGADTLAVYAPLVREAAWYDGRGLAPLYRWFDLPSSVFLEG